MNSKEFQSGWESSFNLFLSMSVCVCECVGRRLTDIGGVYLFVFLFSFGISQETLVFLFTNTYDHYMWATHELQAIEQADDIKFFFHSAANTKTVTITHQHFEHRCICDGYYCLYWLQFSRHLSVFGCNSVEQFVVVSLFAIPFTIWHTSVSVFLLDGRQTKKKNKRTAAATTQRWKLTENPIAGKENFTKH